MKISLSSNRAVFIRNSTERCCFFRTLWQESSPERCTRSLRSFLRTAQSSQSKFPCWRSTTRSCSTCSAPPRTSTSGCSSSTTLATRWRFRKCGCGFFFVSVSFLFLHTYSEFCLLAYSTKLFFFNPSLWRVWPSGRIRTSSSLYKTCSSAVESFCLSSVLTAVSCVAARRGGEGSGGGDGSQQRWSLSDPGERIGQEEDGVHAHERLLQVNCPPLSDRTSGWIL